MLIKFSPRATQSFRTAQTEAEEAGHSCISSHHVLYGLFLVQDGPHFEIMYRAGLTTPLLQQAIRQLSNPAEDFEMVDQFLCGHSTVRALKRAANIIVRAAHTYLGAERILLGIVMEETGPSAALFSHLKTDTHWIQESLLKELNRI